MSSRDELLSSLSPGIATALEVLTETSPRGVFSLAQAGSHGVTEEVIRTLVARGVVVRLIRGWYAVPEQEWDRRALHARAAYAQVRRRDGRAVLSHHSALIHHGLPDLGADLSTTHLTHRESSSRRARHDCVVHRADASTAPGVLEPGSLVVPPSFAVVQSGLLNGPLAALVSGDAALRRKLTTVPEIELAASMYRHAGGIGGVAAMLGEFDARSESAAESLTRYIVTRLGYTVTSQLRIPPEGPGFRVDLALEAEGLIIEFDGRTKYVPDHEGQGDGTRDGKPIADVVMDEKARHRTLERLGWVILRLTWSEIITPGGRLRIENVRRLIEDSLRSRVA